MFYLYKYLFYRVYSFIRKIDKNSPPTVAAHGTITLLTFIFAVDADYIIRSIERAISWDYKRFHFFVIIAIIYSANLLLFNNVSNYQKIETEFSNENHKAFIISTVNTILFLVVAALPIFLH